MNGVMAKLIGSMASRNNESVVTVLGHPATLERQVTLAKLFTFFYCVGNKNQGHPVILHHANSFVAFALELFVPYRKNFVSQ